MHSEIPDELRQERHRIEVEIRRAFKGVTREGGVSWSEANAIDNGGPDEKCAAARATDTDTSWEELVDDPEWWSSHCEGEWTFLDDIGFRYYIAPGMIRCMREIGGVWLQNNLQQRAGEVEFRLLLTAPQLAAITLFVHFMIAVCEALDLQRTPFAAEWRTIADAFGST